MWNADHLAGIYAYLGVVLRAAILTFQSLVVGGVTFVWLGISTPPHLSSSFQTDSVRQSCVRVLRVSALILAGTQALCLLVNCHLLIRTTGLVIADIVGANFVIAAAIAICSGLAIGLMPRISLHRMGLLTLLSLVILASSVMTNHATARMSGRSTLILLTALHLAAAGTWIGGLPYLRIAISAAPDELAAYTFARRFARIATFSVVVLAASGAAAALKYVDSATAVYGTSYGVMLGAKTCLFAVLLVLGALNHRAIKRVSRTNFLPRLQRFVEVEIVVGITVFLAAASLTSQPPAVDLKADRLSLNAIYEHMRPTWPRLRTPDVKDLYPATRHSSDESVAAARTASAGLLQGGVVGHPNTASDIAWSEYNHNWIGLMLLVMGVLALLSRTNRVPISRHWPLVFLALAMFIFVRADPENWPLGQNGFWESFDEIEVVQHRAAAAMVIAFAVFEWRVQRNKTSSRLAPLVFPAVCVLGGALLLTHTHALTNSKEQLLAELSHTPLAILAVLAGCSRWLELRLPGRDRGIPARIWPVCFMLIGALLLTYKEG